MGKQWEVSDLTGYAWKVKQVNENSRWLTQATKQEQTGVEVWLVDPKTGQDAKFTQRYPFFLNGDKLASWGGAGALAAHILAVYPIGSPGVPGGAHVDFEAFFAGPQGTGRVFMWEDYDAGRDRKTGEARRIRLPSQEIAILPGENGRVVMKPVCGDPTKAPRELYVEEDTATASTTGPPPPMQPPAALTGLPPPGAPAQGTGQASAAGAAPAAPAPAPLPQESLVAIVTRLLGAQPNKRASSDQIINLLIKEGKGALVGPFFGPGGAAKLVADGIIKQEADGAYSLPG